MRGISGIINSIVQQQSSTLQYLVDTTSSFSISAVHPSRTSSLFIISINPHTQTHQSKHTFNPGLLVKLPLSFIRAPLTLSPTLALRLWWCTGAAVVPAWCPAAVERVVRVVVVVVVVVAAGVRFVGPRIRVLCGERLRGGLREALLCVFCIVC
jgi:hypothetical protein